MGKIGKIGKMGNNKIGAKTAESAPSSTADDAKEESSGKSEGVSLKKQGVRKLVNMVCNHLYSVLFAKQRESEKTTKKMRDCNRVHHEQYARRIYEKYVDQEAVLNVLIHQNALLEKCEALRMEQVQSEDTKKVIGALHRFVSHLTQNIAFKPLPEMAACDGDSDYLYPMEGGNAMDLYCDQTTRFLLSVYADLIGADFTDILGPLLVGLVHVVFARSKSKKYKKRCPLLFSSFRGNKFYEFVMTAGIRSGGSWIDTEFGKLVARNMNPMLTFLYFGYLRVWNKGTTLSAQSDSQSNAQSPPKLSVLHQCSDLLVAKDKEKLALQILIDTSCCLKKSEKYNEQKTYVSNEYGLIWNDSRILTHFIRLCRLNGKKMEAVLLWQLSTDENRIENALDIVKKDLSVKDVLRVVRHQEESGGENVFQFIWEPLLFCAFQSKFGGRSTVIDCKMNEYLDSTEMGTDPKLKATRLCDYVLNNLHVR